MFYHSDEIKQNYLNILQSINIVLYKVVYILNVPVSFCCSCFFDFDAKVKAFWGRVAVTVNPLSLKVLVQWDVLDMAMVRGRSVIIIFKIKSFYTSPLIQIICYWLRYTITNYTCYRIVYKQNAWHIVK